jgi:hypothetical protein
MCSGMWLSSAAAAMRPCKRTQITTQTEVSHCLGGCLNLEGSETRAVFGK